ncbi:MAG: hypothetical protein VR72_02210 [Clostridiaceae bacterium BRH_c20a]|nr:MAG: hypothetical protein VR72_02210 [Clostridiaceae bacterium BRH_c20a]
MTHTLHRYRKNNEKADDYVLLSMAAQGFNSINAREKLVEVFKIMYSENPDNIGDDNQGGIYTGKKIEEIIENATDKAYMDSVFSSKDSLGAVLNKLKEADLGISVTVTGDMDDVFEVMQDVELKPHTVNLSLGYFGKKELLPDEDILEIVTMCGHSMVCKDHVQYIMKRVEKGIMTTKEAAQDLARPCTCGIFNVKRAEGILERCYRGKEEA